MLTRERKQKLEQNIWKFYLFRVLNSLNFVSPIFVLFLQDNGLSMTQVMILQAIYTAVIMLFTVPSGVLADKIGRKKVLVCSTLLYALGWFIYGSSYTFMGFLTAEIILAFSSAAMTSSSSPFFYDSLKEIKKEQQFKRLFGNVVSINNLVWGFAALIGGYLATYSLRMPFYVSVAFAGVSFILSLTLTETAVYKRTDVKYLVHLKDALYFSARHPKVRLFMAYAALLYSIGFVAYMLYQPYLETIKISLSYFGLVYFALSLTTALGSKWAYKIETKLGEKKTLIIILLATLLSLLGMAFQAPITGVILPLIIAFFSGFLEPVIVDYINKHVESHHRATVSSLENLLTQGLSTVLLPIAGWVVDFWSLKTAFLASGILLGINLIFLLLILYGPWNGNRDEKKPKANFS